MELGFVVLALALFGTALFFAFRDAQTRLRTAMKSRDRRTARELKAMKAELTQKDAEFAELKRMIASVPNKAISMGNGFVAPFDRTQDRYERQQREMPEVLVNDSPVRVG